MIHRRSWRAAVCGSLVSASTVYAQPAPCPWRLRRPPHPPLAPSPVIGRALPFVGAPVAWAAPPASPPPPPPAAPDTAAPDEPEATGEVIEIEARGPTEQELLLAQSASAADIHIAAAPWRAVPRPGAADFLTLAGVFLTKTAGSGDPEQIFLRGFDAREGQDLEVSLEGLPLNDVANPHGHGLVDLHFLMPEVVRSLRVEEGPFRAGQGDFAVAGSATYTLGMDEPGLQARWTTGSFGTRRGFVGWRAERDPGTFVAASIGDTAGYGDNRAAQSGGAIVRIGGGVAPERDGTSWRLLAGAWSSAFASSGLIRADDVAAGRIDRFGDQ